MALKPKLANGAGRKRTRVVVQIATDSRPNSVHEVVTEYLTGFTCYAEEMMTSGREFQLAMQTVASLQGILKLPFNRKTKAISARDRVVIGDRVLEIATKPINEGGQNEKMVLWVVESEEQS